MEDVVAEVKKWDPAETERVTGVPGSQLKRVAKIMANNRPGTFMYGVWVARSTQTVTTTPVHIVHCSLLSETWVLPVVVLIFSVVTDNVQGATDFCVLSHSLPGYYGLSAGSWKLTGPASWETDVDYLKGRFASLSKR